MIDEIKDYILKNSIGDIDESLSFKDLTTFRIGGKIRLVYFPDSIENFIKFDKKMKEINEDYLVIGNGSNILASDNYYNKIVVSFKKLKVKYFIINDEFFLFPQLKVNEIVRKFIELGYCDIEYFSGIPGTIGGLLTMNASCFEKVISDYLIEALVLYDDGIKWLKKEELDFKYRSSKIKEEKMVLLLAKMKFPKTNNKKEIYDNLVKLLKIRNQKQPVNYKSAGCAFKNLCDKKAWEIIKELGYCGKRVGGAKVSEKHCNFILNDNNASANEVYELMKMIKEEAYNKKILLENEWILINFD